LPLIVYTLGGSLPRARAARRHQPTFFLIKIKAQQ
jgi:hypothetical protein